MRERHVPPSAETIREYFRFHLPVQYEVNSKVTSPPWLLAAELEFPGSAYAFFHPLFDLIFGPVISSSHWNLKTQLIPDEWINEEMEKGNTEQAKQWQFENSTMKPRKHRKLQPNRVDPLYDIHCAILRLPSEVHGELFERRGLASGWFRKYQPISDEISAISKLRNIHSLAALLALAKEAREIGNSDRLYCASNAVVQNLSLLEERPEYAIVASDLKHILLNECSNLTAKSYRILQAACNGLPSSWVGFILAQHHECEMEKIVRRYGLVTK